MNNQNRVIFHVDCNSFFASVELLRRPELRDVPVAVAGSTDNRHGIILAKNEAAKKYGVQTAETVWQAQRKCPGLQLLPPHHKEYHKYSRILNDIYANYTDMVEPFGIDESWLDVSGSWQLFGSSPREVADTLRRQVTSETGLTVSIGLSFNKIFAKLGSDYKKPDAVTEITRQNYKDILWPLPVSDMLYVGAKSRQTLASISIHTIGDLAKTDPEMLRHVLGKQGPQLVLAARGEDATPVALAGEYEAPKSVGNGLTFRRNLVGERDVRTGLTALSDEVATRLRRHNLYASSLQVQIKDPSLKSISRQKSLPYATNLAKDLAKAAMELVRSNWNLSHPIRMLTVTAQNLCDTPFAVQTSLLGEPPSLDAKRERLEKSIDSIRQKFGTTSVLQAGALNNDIGLDSRATPQRGEDEDDNDDKEVALALE